MTTQKTAIVTAAGKGMGAAIARELAAVGYNLALLSASGGAVDLAKELGGFGLTGSVTSQADLQKLVEGAMGRYGPIDAVVNNTGHPPKGQILQIPDEETEPPKHLQQCDQAGIPGCASSEFARTPRAAPTHRWK